MVASGPGSPGRCCVAHMRLGTIPQADIWAIRLGDLSAPGRVVQTVTGLIILFTKFRFTRS